MKRLNSILSHPFRVNPLLPALWLVSIFSVSALGAPSQPNIVLIMAEDIGPDLSCYGHPAVSTPHIDALARNGTRYTSAFGTASSCTPARNAMMTGLYQTRTDTQDQRRKIDALPQGVVPLTHRLQAAGYYTALGCGFSAKTDLNFKADNLFDSRDWAHRAEDQPFFAQITLYSSHRLEDGWAQIHESAANPVDPSAVEFPPYFPDHPTIRSDWARYLESIQKVDEGVGQIMQRLQSEGMAENTIVIFMGDNGRCHLRSKCWLYDAGLRVPLIMSGPKALIKQGSVEDELVSVLDISASILAFAGIDIPEIFDGQPLIGKSQEPRDAIYAARDLVDEIMDRIRCVRTKEYKYIRNYNPENGYKECIYVQENRPMLPVIRELGKKGLLTPAQTLILKDRKPLEELYDIENDPHEINNLAGQPEHQEILIELRERLDDWIEETGDTGLKQHWANRQGVEDPTTYLAELSKEFEKRWPHNRRITIAVHGHSVPTGYTTKGVVKPFDAYPHLLRIKLKERYPLAVINVVVTGIGGENAVQGVKRFESDVLAFNPDIITIDYALNDRSVGLEPTRQAWSKMIKRAKASGAKVLLLTPTGDTRAAMSDIYDPLSQHASQIRSLAAQYGVGLVDSYQQFIDYEKENGPIKPIMAQGNHPNRLGHELVVEELAKWFPSLN